MKRLVLVSGLTILLVVIILGVMIFLPKNKEEKNMVAVTAKLLIHSPIENGQIEIYWASYGASHESRLDLIKFDNWFGISSENYTSGDVFDIGVRHIDEEFVVDHMYIAYNVKLPTVEEPLGLDFFDIRIETGVHDYENKLELGN